MGMPVRFNKGDAVVMTQENISEMKKSNNFVRTAGYPSLGFISLALSLVGEVGEVTDTFLPGYEVTARFKGRYFHMKDNWITKAEGCVGMKDIQPRTYLSQSEGKWRVVHNGLPLCADKDSAAECLPVAKQFNLTLDDLYWNGDLGQFLKFSLL